MAVPTFQSRTGTAFNGTAPTDHNVNMPASVSSGDLLLILFSCASTSVTYTTPSGWSILIAKTTATTGAGIVYAKIADGSEGGTTVNVVTSSAACADAYVFRFSNWYGDLTTGVQGTMSADGTTANQDCPSLTWSPSPYDVYYVTLCFDSNNRSSTTITGYPTNYTNGATDSNTTGFGKGHCTTAYRSVTSGTSAENPDNFVFSVSPGASTVTGTIVVLGKMAGIPLRNPHKTFSTLRR